MRSIERLGTFEEIIDGRAPEVVELARRLRALIEELHPDVVEVPRTGEGVAAYGVGERKMSESYAYLAPQRSWVNLGLYHGALLPDPERVVEGTGARIRHVKVRADGPDQAILRALLIAARDERERALQDARGTRER